MRLLGLSHLFRIACTFLLFEPILGYAIQDNLIQIPLSVWQKGREVANLKKNKTEPERLIPELISQVLTEQPARNVPVPPNFATELKDAYLGNFNRLDKSQAEFAMDCYLKHLRHVDMLNKGMNVEKQVREFAFGVHNNRCISYFFNELEYQQSALAEVERLKGACINSEWLGRFIFPIEIDRSEDNFLMFKKSISDSPSPNLAKNNLNDTQSFHFKNESKNLMGEFKSDVAFDQDAINVINFSNKDPILQSNFAVSIKSIRGTATEPEDRSMSVRIRRVENRILIEHRLKLEKDWTSWSTLLPCR